MTQTSPAAQTARPRASRRPAAPARAEKPIEPAAAAKTAAPKMLHVVDTTAQPGQPPRVHEMPVAGIATPFSFEHGKPLPMPHAVALRFLRHETFVLTDADGKPLPFQRRPKQPEELQAGEQLKLADDEVVARYEELSTIALQTRVLELPGSEHFAAERPDRKAMIAFLQNAKAEAKARTASSEPDIGDGEFVPAAEEDGLILDAA
jgi:hypothetical protein